MLVGGATCIGESHKRSGIPLQDSFKVFTDPSRRYVIAVVSDGAGSAKHAEVGSQRICSAYTSEVRRLCEKSNAVSLDAFKETTSFAIQSARRSLVDDGYLLTDCHATIVATLAFDDKCFLVHLGDGLQVVLIREPSGAIAACISEPENGDASNETFFYTEDDWYQHLRITEIPRDVLACFIMSDGMEEFVWNPKSGLKLPFCRPLLQKARDAVLSGGELNATLEDVVSDERTNQFTNDDKTLCLVLRSSSPVVIDETGSNLNQYVIRNGHPVKFSQRHETGPAPSEIKKTASSVDLTAQVKAPRVQPVSRSGPAPSMVSASEKLRAIESYKRTSGVFVFILGLACFLIGLVSGYLLNEIEQDAPWVVKSGPSKAAPVVVEKGLEESNRDISVTSPLPRGEATSSTSTSPHIAGSDVLKDPVRSTSSRDSSSSAGPVGGELKANAPQGRGSVNPATSSRLSSGEPLRADVSNPASVSKGDKNDVVQSSSKGSAAAPKAPPSEAPGSNGK